MRLSVNEAKKFTRSVRWTRAKALAVPHKSGICFCLWAEEFPAQSKIMHSLKTEPERLRAGRIATRTIDVATQFCDHPHHFSQGRRFARWRFVLHYLINRFPFCRFKDCFAAQLRTSASQAADIQCPPSDNQVDSQTAELTINDLKPPLLSSTARFKRSEEDLHHPANAVILDHLTNRFHGVNWQAREKQPLHRHVTFGRMGLANQHDVDGHLRQLPFGAPGARSVTRMARTSTSALREARGCRRRPFVQPNFVFRPRMLIVLVNSTGWGKSCSHR